MGTTGPVIIGGSGHSGTRVFNEILSRGGVFTGIRRVTKWPESEDLKIIDLLSRWVRPYVYGTLSQSDVQEMKAEFSRRLRLYFPIRSWLWGFKNPRTLLILPFLHGMFPNMKFVHVVRDGRDISLGNKFASNNAYAEAFLSNEEKQLAPEDKMILFWGRSNARAMEYGTMHMRGRYLLMRWEDLCTHANEKADELLRFATSQSENVEDIARIVKRPKSLGRWKSYAEDVRARVTARGQQWLSLFGYI